ncbi:unnamed protein product [Blepharisma stoltei]|uniref:chitin synthase n=1 Tax=Blepharisma stoltei TaxID=1481888 RepID=A0AAU9IT09_9CILI|nr:unnamed protein product [Blepharisma stoltei]
MDAFQSNIYLAEDRVLCLALVSKKNRDYILRYVKNSIAETDVPDKLSVLMAQRRRWINGSWFALIDSIKRMSSVFESGHSTTRKCCFTMQMIYYVVNVVFSWFMVGSFFLAFAIAVRKQFGEDSDSTIISFSGWIIISYTTLLIIVFIMALGVKPKRVEDAYKVIACIFGVYMLLTMGLMFKYIITNLSSNSWIIPLMVATIFCFAMNTLCHGATLTVLKGVLHFVFLSPSYVNLFLVYAICNIHDCTWGNRPDQQSDEERAHLEEFEEFRTRWAIVWALCNSAFAYYLNLVDKSGSDATRWYIYSIAFVGVGLLIIRFCGGIMYLCQENWCQKKLRVKAQVVPSPMPILASRCETNQELLGESRNPIIAVAEASRKNTEEDSFNGMIEEEKLEIDEDDFNIDEEEDLGMEENVKVKNYPKINVTVLKPAYSERKVNAGNPKKYKHIKNAIRQPIKNSKFLNELMKAGSHKAQKSALMIQSWFRSWKCRETYQKQRRFFDYLAFGKTILQHSFYFVSIYKTIKEAHFKNRLMRKKVEVNIVVDAYPLEKGLSKPIELNDSLANVCSRLEIEPDEAELRRQQDELLQKIRIKNDLVDICNEENKEEKIIARKIYTGKTELADGIEYDVDIIYVFGNEKKIEISAIKGKFSYFYTMYLDMLQDLETVQKKIPFILSRLMIEDSMLQFKS